MKSSPHWKPIGLKNHHGIVVPLSGIRTKESYGVGEFLDLIALIDFCKKVGFDTIQLLPINDMGNNTSPYSAISSCALDPLFLSLSKLPYVKPYLKKIESLKKLSHTKRVDIHEVKQQKLSFLYHYFTKVFEKISATESYQTFVEEEKSWLFSFAKFKVLRNHFQNAHFKDWPKKLPNTPKVELEFQYFLQYLCFSQMQKVKAYATKVGCFIKGDIPILLCPNSADLWHEKELFLLNPSAGSPPDSFNRFGQAWGLPICKWDEMRKDGFAWWQRRLKTAAKFYHIYRIDHVVGLFRIWAVPDNKGPLQGHFIPEDRSEWEPLGRELLSMMLDATDALPIGEDLGTIPPEVPEVLKEYGICGTKVMHWEKKNEKLIPIDQYEPFSLTTVSTHDLPTLQMWWRDSKDEAKLLCKEKNWSYDKDLSLEKRFEILFDAHHTSSYFHINLLQEYLALFPELVSEHSNDERINISGMVLLTNWTYRFKPSIEEMSQHTGLIEAMRSLIQPPN